jgi:hypothetical protein
MDVDRDGIEGWFSKDPTEIVEKLRGAIGKGQLFRQRCHDLWHAHHARLHHKLDGPFSPQL